VVGAVLVTDHGYASDATVRHHPLLVIHLIEKRIEPFQHSLAVRKTRRWRMA